MKASYLIMREVECFEYCAEEVICAFEVEVDAELFCLYANENHINLMNDFQNKVNQFHKDYEIWRLGSHKVKPKTGPNPSFPQRPVNKYDVENDDFDSIESRPRVTYAVKSVKTYSYTMEFEEQQ